MNFHPILFTTDMARAIKNGHKDVTRRLISPQPDDHGLHDYTNFPRSVDIPLRGWVGTVGNTGETRVFKHNYGPAGDGLWVREAWKWEDGQIGSGWYVHRADYIDEAGPWKPGVHMPKEACSRFLKLVKITPERAHDITEADAIREGVSQFINMRKDLIGWRNYLKPYKGATRIEDIPVLPTARESYISLWQKINGIGSWAPNPWVWRIEFTETFRPVNWPDAN